MPHAKKGRLPYQEWIDTLERKLESVRGYLECSTVVKDIIKNLEKIEFLKHLEESQEWSKETFELYKKTAEENRKRELEYLADSKKTREKLQKEYDDFQKRNEERLKEERNRLLARLIEINKRLDEILKEQQEIIVKMVMNLDEMIEMRLEDIPGLRDFVKDLAEENKVIRISRYALQQSIISSSKEQRPDDMNVTPASIIGDNLYKLLKKQLPYLGEAITPETDQEIQQYATNVGKQALQKAAESNATYDAEFSALKQEQIALVTEQAKIQENLRQIESILNVVQPISQAILAETKMNTVTQEKAQKMESASADKTLEQSKNPATESLDNKKSAAPAPTQQSDKTLEKKETTHPAKLNEEVKKQNPEQAESHAVMNKETTKKTGRRNLSEALEKTKISEKSEPSSSPRPSR